MSKGSRNQGKLGQVKRLELEPKGLHSFDSKEQKYELYISFLGESYHQIAWSVAMNFIGYVDWTTTIPGYRDFSFLIWDEL